MSHRESGPTAWFFVWKKPKVSRERAVFLLFFAAMALYYAYRLFALTPWYDELYTYYYFISRGPLYAAIHWPLPNNHVGYSALSACLGVFGSAPVALRGVSWLCSMGSLLLLYRISEKWFAGRCALVPVFLFAGMYMVNQLAVQGRGYAFVTFCYLSALQALYAIVAEKKNNKRNYIAFGASLMFSLWAIPSSLYMVMPLCLIGGFLLLLDRDYKRLWRLLAASLMSAFCTAGLYGILWLAIGSNLLSKAADGPFSGMGHVRIILRAPFAALGEGISYMLATPYIQSMARQDFFDQAGHWLSSLFGMQLAPRFGLQGGLMCALLGLGVLSAAVCLVRRRGEHFLEWYLALTPCLLGAALFVQCKLPYQRVFSFLGVWAALLLGWLVQQGYEILRRREMAGACGGGMQACGLSQIAGKPPKGHPRTPAAFFSVTGVFVTLSYLLAGLFWAFTLGDQTPYSLRDELLSDAYRQIAIKETDTVAVTDCDQEYLLLYLHGIGEERVSRQIEVADVAVFDKALFGEPYDHREDPEAWKFYLSGEEAQTAVAYARERMTRVYENGQFVLYRK